MKISKTRNTLSMMKSSGLILILLLVTSFAEAMTSDNATADKVVEYVNYNIEKTLTPLSDQETSPEWELKRIWIRVQSSLGIKIPWVLSFQVVPEVEFIFEN